MALIYDKEFLLKDNSPEVGPPLEELEARVADIVKRNNEEINAYNRDQMILKKCNEMRREIRKKDMMEDPLLPAVYLQQNNQAYLTTYQHDFQWFESEIGRVVSAPVREDCSVDDDTDDIAVAPVYEDYKQQIIGARTPGHPKYKRPADGAPEKPAQKGAQQ